MPHTLCPALPPLPCPQVHQLLQDQESALGLCRQECLEVALQLMEHNQGRLRREGEAIQVRIMRGCVCVCVCV